MASEGFEFDEEWEADFIDQAVQAEELALSTLTQQHQHPQVQHLPPPPPPPPPPPLTYSYSYSPPRQLSQRPAPQQTTSDCFDAYAPRISHLPNEHEIDRLKKELGRVSKQLNHLERECSELRKQRDEKEEQLKVVHSRIEAKDAEFLRTKNTESDCLVSHQQSFAPGQNVACTTVGVQTDNTTELNNSSVQNAYRGSQKLFALWNSDDQKLGRVLVSKLFVTCEGEFHVLFGYLNKLKMNVPRNDTGMDLRDQVLPTQPIEAAKVSHLYSVLTKISNETSRLEDLFEALVDLCSLQNVDIVYRSLRVLHMILSNSFSMVQEFGKRENVMVEEPLFGSSKSDIEGCGNLENQSILFANVEEMLKQGQFPFGLSSHNAKPPRSSGFFICRFASSISAVYWVSLFENICKIATMNNEELVRREALSVTNLILMRQNAYLERDKFVNKLVLESLSQLLRRESGFLVQDKAVHTLYLLCNCPKVIAMLSYGFKEDRENACSKDEESISSTFHGFNEILNGLADCLSCYESTTAEEMTLRRNAIVLLALVGSSGKTGLQILLNYRPPKSTNFLAIILQSLISDLDLQTSKPARQCGTTRELSLLIREALIFLNRLVSHPQYSLPVLQSLTNTREMASVTVDVANRLTNRSNFLCQDDNTTIQVKESEILDLAWIFKKRVFTFLGDSFS